MNKFAIFALLFVASVWTQPFLQKNQDVDWQRVLTNDEHSTKSISFRVSLKQNNVDVLNHILEQVSDPTHSSYGKHLNNEEIKKLVALEEHEITLVENWLQAISDKSLCPVQMSRTIHHDHIQVSTCVRQAEHMFNLKMVEYYHPAIKTTTLVHENLIKEEEKMEALKVPTYIQELVAYIDGLTTLPVVADRAIRAYMEKSGGKKLQGQQGINIDPSVIRKNYGTPNTKPSTSGAQSSQAVAEFQGQYYSSSDLSTFQKDEGVTANPVYKGEGTNNQDQPGIETMLDLEYIAINQLETWDFYASNFDLTAWATTVQSTSGAPKTHSVSYGAAESQFEKSQMTSASNEFMKMGVAGYSILISSGDDGPYPRSSCFTFSLSFPASSPYVTSVGATYITSDSTNDVGVVFSGGGFSKTFAAPTWQTAAIASYFENVDASKNPKSSLYDKNMRATPDVSAYGTNFFVVADGQTQRVGGTSASSPTFAAIIASIQAERQAAGKGPLGFLNPALYQLGSVGYDVLSGNNNNDCGFFGLGGYEAAKGFDPITGLGAPRYEYLSTNLGKL